MQFSIVVRVLGLGRVFVKWFAFIQLRVYDPRIEFGREKSTFNAFIFGVLADKASQDVGSSALCGENEDFRLLSFLPRLRAKGRGEGRLQNELTYRI